jgi:hemoglobin
MLTRMSRPSIYEFAGGAPAFRALAAAHHARCLADPLLEHPFSHGVRPDHVERLAAYWAEVFGGPAGYGPGHSGMLLVHSGAEPGNGMDERFVECFVAAADDAGLPADPEFRAVLRAYMEAAVAEVMAHGLRGDTVADGIATPRWGWTGRQD